MQGMQRKKYKRIFNAENTENAEKKGLAITVGMFILIAKPPFTDIEILNCVD
jgi:hypothetical protein